MARFSPLVDWVGGDGAAAWDIHVRALRAQAEGRDVIVMSVGDPDFATPAGITKAAVEALRGGDTHYTAIRGDLRLRQLIAEQHQLRTGQAVTAENVIVLAGAQSGLFSTSLCVAGRGDEVISFDPMYVTYEAALRASGAELVRVPQPAEGGFRPDLDALARAITPRTRAIFIANPANPTGVVMRRDELAGIADLACRHDLWVVSDEVYAELVFDGEMNSIAALPGMAERTVTVSSLSKSHAMTGWRLGWAIGPKALIDHMENLALCMLYGLPGFVQQAGIHALTEAADEVARMREIYRQRRDLVLGELDGVAGLRCLSPQAGMFLMLDIRATGLGSGEFAERLYEYCGVSVLDAAAFGAVAEGYVRLSFTVGEEALREGCARIVDFVRRWAAGNTVL